MNIREWAMSAEVGDYLSRYDEEGLDAYSDPGSRCGYGDRDLSDVQRILRERDLSLVADDEGLVVEAFERD